MSNQWNYISVYNREACDAYPGGLAYSVHFSVSKDGQEETALNKNYGILFAKADIREDNTLAPVGICNPKITQMAEGIFCIIGEPVREEGNEDASKRGFVWHWKTGDFVEFEDCGLISLENLNGYHWSDSVAVDADILGNAVNYWNPVINTCVTVPYQTEISTAEELQQITATAHYNDGSAAVKKVAWNVDTVNFDVPGDYPVKGKVLQAKYKFPLACGYGDPVLLPWEGKWYYIATNDNLNDIGLYMREADSVADLFAEGITEHLILAEDEKRQLVQTFWAPEFHMIGGELYILFAVSGSQWGPQCQVMKLKKGHSLICADSWEDPIPVKRMDGSPLAPNAISLDMTFIHTPKKSYMVWSYRKGIGTPLDTGSMIYIASVDEEKPWMLTSEPVLLTRPLLGWENLQGTINNEGPYAFVKDGKVYLTYSGGSANKFTYALGLLTADAGDDLLDIHSWKKRCTPVLSYYSVEGEFGPGHNAFYTDENGELMISYHGETAIDKTLRCVGIRRVHFKTDGTPVFGMSAEEDLNHAFEDVQMTVTVK